MTEKEKVAAAAMNNESHDPFGIAEAFEPAEALPRVLDSIHRQDKHHPFPEEAPGQPFFLDYLYNLALMAADADADYCNALKHGVPLGVDAPPLQSPSMWPTKG